MKKKTFKIIVTTLIMTAAIFSLSVCAFAEDDDVAGAIENTWDTTST